MIDPDWPTEEDKPWVIARKRFGRIAIANSDAARRAYTDAAIDQAHRGCRDYSSRISIRQALRRDYWCQCFFRGKKH